MYAHQTPQRQQLQQYDLTSNILLVKWIIVITVEDNLNISRELQTIDSPI